MSTVDMGTIAAACGRFLDDFNNPRLTLATEHRAAIDELLEALDAFHLGRRP